MGRSVALAVGSGSTFVYFAQPIIGTGLVTTARTLVIMALCLNIPHLCFVVLSQLAGPGHTLSFWTVASLVTLEKFGYSFGMVANMLYMMQQISPGKYHMTHYAYCTAIMNLTLIPTQMASGFLADHMGFQTFFLVVMALGS